MVSGSGEEGPRVQSQDEIGTAPDADGEPTGVPPNWTHDDLMALADQVYELLLRDLVLERERGVW